MYLLIIDANEQDYKLFARYLEYSDDVLIGWRSTLAEGLAFLAQTPVDVVLLDLNLPDSQGLETLGRLQAQFPLMTVVVASSDEREEQAIEVVRRGAEDYLVKQHLNTYILTKSLRYALERNRANAQIYKLNRTLQVLSDINQAIVRIRDLPLLFRTACEIAVDKGGFSSVWIGLVDRTRRMLVPVAASGAAAEFMQTYTVSLDKTPPPVSIQVIASGQPLIINDMTKESSLTLYRDRAVGLKALSVAAFPLVIAGEVRGVFNLYSSRTNMFDKVELRLLEEMAGDIAFAMEFAEREDERQRAQQRQLESEARYHDALNSLMEGAQIIDREWRYIYVNEAVSRQGQQAREALLGRTMMEAYPGIETTPLFDVLRDCMQTRLSQRIENEFAYPDGSQGWFELSIQPVDEGLFILSLDITERKQSEQQLRRYARQMEILHEIDTGIIEARSTEEVVTAALGHLRHLITCKRASVVLFNPDRTSGVVWAVDREQTDFMDQGQPLPFLPSDFWEGFSPEYTRRIDDFNHLETPHARIVRDSGYRSAIYAQLVVGDNLAGLLILASDKPNFFTSEDETLAAQVTVQLGVGLQQMHLREELTLHSRHLEISLDEIRRGEQSLRESEARFNTMANAAPVLIWVSGVDKQMTFFNNTWLAFTGRHIDQEIGSGWLQGVHPDDYGRCLSVYTTSFDARESFSMEYRLRHRSGAYRWILDIGVPRYHPNGAFAGYIGSAVDIDDRKHTEQELASLYNATAYLFNAESLQALSAQIVESVVQEFEHADCGLMLVDYGQKALVRLARTGRYHIQPNTPLTLDGAGLVPLAIRTGEMIYVPDVMKEPHYLPSESRTRSELVVPLRTPKGIIAVLDLQRAEINAFSDRDMRVLTAFAERAAAAIETMQLYEQINQYAAELEARVAQRTVQLKEAKDSVEAILNNSPDGILLVNAALQIQKTNYAFERLFAEGLHIGRPFSALIHEEDQARVMAAAAEALTRRQSTRLEVRAQRRDGTMFHVELNFGVFGTDIEESIVCTLRDITERKQAEEALRQSEQRYRMLAENIKDVVMKTTPDGIRTYITPSCYSLLGYMPDELLRQPQIMLTHPDDRPAIRALTEQIMTTSLSSYSLTQRTRHKHGYYIWVEITSNVIRNGKTGAPIEIVAAMRDITVRKRTEEALRESETRYRMLAENITDVVANTDFKGNLTYISPSSRYVLGYAPGDMSGGSIFEYLMPEDVPGAQALLLQALEPNGPTLNMTSRFRHAEGHYIWLEVNGRAIKSDTSPQPMGLILSARNVTDRKQAEDALRDSEARYRLLADNITDMITRSDMSGRYLYVSQSVGPLLGYTQHDLLGRSLTDFVHDDDRAQVQEVFSQIQSANPPVLTFRVRCKDGAYLWLEMRSQIIQGREGQEAEIVSTSRDITKRKQAEETLQQALEKEKELSELKSRFVSMASHEFRTPLATILALTETIQAYYTRLTDDQVSDRLGKIQEQVGYLKNIMEDVLLLARMQARRVEFAPTLLDFDALCRSVLDEFQGHPEMRHRFVYQYDTNLETVVLDKKLMRQMISNLISNAIKYSPDHPDIAITVSSDGPNLTFTIQDKGIGIPDADLKHLFEPFHRAANVGTISGTGLGLIITKEAVELHNGSIQVDSREGDGTTFTIELPTHVDIKPSLAQD